MSYTLALGPFTQFWRGPQRLVLKVEGETVTDVEYRGGYNERGCAERLPRLDLEQALHLVARVSGSSSHAHAMVFCQALEALTETTVPERAAYLRCFVAELERAMSHLSAVQTIFDLLGLQQPAHAISDVILQAREVMLLVSGRPSLPDVCIPGGLRRNISDGERDWLLTLLSTVHSRLFQLIDQMIDERGLLARMVDVGVLTRHVVEQFGLRGPMARAAGLEVDTRLDQPYAAYAELPVRRIMQDGGDVHARFVVLMLEAFESLKLAEQALQSLPDGDYQGQFPPELAAGVASAAVESPRGLLRYTLQSDGHRLTAVTIDAPRQIDRLLARTLFVGALVDDVMLIALSTDVSVACAEG